MEYDILLCEKFKWNIKGNRIYCLYIYIDPGADPALP